MNEMVTGLSLSIDRGRQGGRSRAWLGYRDGSGIFYRLQTYSRRQTWIAMAMVAPVVVGLTWWIGLPELSAAGALILSIQGLSL